MNGKESKLIVILGPTASGKTKVAANVAHSINGEIISADSRQVYKDMNLGTGKDYSDYQVNGHSIKYHLIDIKMPGEKYNVYEFQKDFLKVFDGIQSRQKIALMCGGTGMYIDAVTKGYKLIHVPVNEELRTELENKSHEELIDLLKSSKKVHNVSDLDTKKRTLRAIEIDTYYKHHPEINLEMPALNKLFIGIRYTREHERENITNRLTERLQDGMVDEVDALFKRGLSFEDIVYYGLEYKYVAMYLQNKMTYEEMFRKLNTSIHQFAKRQRTWFRKMEKEGVRIHWIDGELPMNEKVKRALDKIHPFLKD